MWSITVNDLDAIDTQAVKDAAKSVTGIHPEYEHDLLLALEFARRAGLSSATLAGVRAPNPYADDEVVDISIRGMVKSHDFVASMGEIVGNGPARDSMSVLNERASAVVTQMQCAHNFEVRTGCELFEDCDAVCTLCGVHLYCGLLHFPSEHLHS